jgi:hypothetical protein
VGTDRAVNAIRISATEYLLTVTGGDAVHLTREGPGESGQSAVPEHYPGQGQVQLAVLLRGYDPAAITAPRWAPATLCGREWLTMAGSRWWDDDLGDADAAAPSCRGCLALMDKLFPAPELDGRFDLAVQVIAGTVAEHSYAEMRDVPGDQRATLRKQVRSAVKKRTGHPVQTLAIESLLVFVCEPVHQQHASEREHAIAQTFASSLTRKSARPSRRPGACPGIPARPGDGLMSRCRAGRPRRSEDGE